VCTSAAPSCAFIDLKSGKVFQLDALKHATGQFTGSDNSYDYYMNVCDDLKSKSDCKDKKDNKPCAVGQYEQAGKGGGFVASLGYFNDGGQPKWDLYDSTDPEKGVKYQFTNGDECFTQGGWIPRPVNVNFRCKEPSLGPDKMTVTEGENCVFTINIDGVGCPGGVGPDGPSGDKSGLSFGSIFLIIVLVVTVVYVVGGCIFKTQKQGTKGIESCPNIDFWRELPGLTKDGFSYTFNMIRSGCKSGHADSYQTV
jgi:hypothetical protein